MFDLSFYNQLKKYSEMYIYHKYVNRDRKLCHNISNGRSNSQVKHHLEGLKEYKTIGYDNQYFIEYLMYFQFQWVTYKNDI